MQAGWLVCAQLPPALTTVVAPATLGGQHDIVDQWTSPGQREIRHVCSRAVVLARQAVEFGPRSVVSLGIPRTCREGRRVIHGSSAKSSAKSSTTATPARGGRGLPVRLGAVSTRSFRPTADPARRVAAVVCGLEALVMAGFGVYGLVELARGGGTDTARVITESALILLFAVGMGALARLWLGRSSWPGTPTVVWHALLIPVVVSMAQAGQWLVTVALVGAIVAAIGAVVLARGSSED